MDGWVIVGVGLDTKQLEKDLKAAQKRLQQYEKEAEQLMSAKSKSEENLAPYNEEIAKLKEKQKWFNKQITNEKERSAYNIKLQGELDALNNKYSQQISSYQMINQQIKQNAVNQAVVKEEIEQTNAKLNSAKGIRTVDNVLDKIGKKTSNVMKQVTKWGLMVLGIRSAYSFVQRSMSTLSQYNKQLATDLEYIRFALATALQKPIEQLIQLVFKLLSYLDYLVEAWFGVSLFANASADAMKKGAGSAEKMRKSLQGFDEMNVVSDTSGGGAGSGTPSVDLSLSKIKEGEEPQWLLTVRDVGKWILDNWEDVVGALLMIGMLINALTGNWIGFFAGLIAFTAVGVKKIVDSFKELWTDLVEWWNTSGKELFLNVLKGIGQTIKYLIQNFINTIVLIFTGIVAAVTAPFKMIADIIESIFNGVVGVVKGIINTIIKLFKGDFKGALNSFKSIFKSIMDSLWGIVKAPLNMIIGGINSLIKGMNKIKFDVPDWVPGIGGKKLGFNIKEIPRLAVGGIVNMPSRGIPIGGAIAGEAGAEGVIPLTDSQAMETLGQAIGKYINISATVPVYVGNRQIAREIKKINAENDFAFNR